MPVKVYEEPYCVTTHGGEIAAMGQKALIVTGMTSARRCGALSDVCTALEMYGTNYTVFSGVEGNPSVETVRKAAAMGKEEGCDFVIGIGGGSPQDSAKAAAFLMKQDDPMTADLYDAEMSSDAFPVIEVPTTCGTGSEVTGVAVLTLHEKRTKKSIPHKIFPKIALIDGRYLKKAPLTMIAQTSVDALCHLTESFLSVKADAYSIAAAREGLRTWSTVKDILTGAREPSEDDFFALMRSATFAGIAIAQTGTSIPHALSYPVTYDDKIPHGPACALFLARFVREASPEDQQFIYENAGFADYAEFESYLAGLLEPYHLKGETRQRAYDIVVQDKARMGGCRIEATPESLKRIAGF